MVTSKPKVNINTVQWENKTVTKSDTRIIKEKKTNKTRIENKQKVVDVSENMFQFLALIRQFDEKSVGQL